MVEIPFNIGIINWFASNRSDFLTDIFLFFSFFGAEFGYILIIAGLYWIYDKPTAFKLALLVAFTTLINHLLKIMIRNPRPYVSDGTFLENWAVDEETAIETAKSFSTPSGHAQGSASFWWYLHLKLQSRITFVLLFIMIIMIGLSRPYLGVHYLEDVILGWLLGFFVLIIFIKLENFTIENYSNINSKIKYLLYTLPPFLLVIVAGLLFNFNEDGTNFATLSGLISGLGVGYTLENVRVRFIPNLSIYVNNGAFYKVLIGSSRLIIGLLISVGIFIGLDLMFASISPDESFLGYILRFIRYATLGFLTSFVVPWLFVKLKLGSTEH